LKRNKKTNDAKKAKPAKSAASTGPMDVDLLQRIVDLMASNDLNKVDLRDGDRRIILKRGPAQAPVAPAAYPYPPQFAAPAAPPQLPAAPAASAPAESAPPAEDESNLVPIKSPMVGTFYARPSPDAKPFVTVGSRVEEDTDVCIIEAMKVFNNIKAETRGTIVKILVEDRQTVEFGTVLFLVKP